MLYMENLNVISHISKLLGPLEIGKMNQDLSHASYVLSSSKKHNYNFEKSSTW